MQAKRWRKSTSNTQRKTSGPASNSTKFVGTTLIALKNKPDMCTIWQSKQESGFCGTWVQVGLYFGHKYPNIQCPYCSAKETDTHLMRCPDKDRTCMLIDNVYELCKWMETNGKTDLELLYWILKYILLQNNKPFYQSAHKSPRMGALAESQDKIRWWHFSKWNISVGRTRPCLVCLCSNNSVDWVASANINYCK